jgi:hypothetical protein
MNKQPVAVALALGACGVADRFQAQSRMEKSGDAYRTGVSANLKSPNECDPLKAIYEKDKAEYEQT